MSSVEHSPKNIVSTNENIKHIDSTALLPHKSARYVHRGVLRALPSRKLQERLPDRYPTWFQERDVLALVKKGVKGVMY